MWPLFSVCLDLYSFLSCLRLRSSVKFRNSSSSITHSDTRPTPLTLCLRSSVLTLEAVNVPGSVTFLAAVASPDVVRCSNQFRDALPGRTVEGQVVCPPYRIGCPHYLGTVAQLYDYQVLSLYLSTVPPQAWWASDAVPHLTRSHTHPFRRRRTMASSRPPSFTPLSLETPAYTTTTSISPVPSPHSVRPAQSSPYIQNTSLPSHRLIPHHHPSQQLTTVKPRAALSRQRHQTTP